MTQHASVADTAAAGKRGQEPARESVDLPQPTSSATDSSSSTSASASASASSWTPSGGARLGTGLAIALENVAYGFRRPSILDIKLGAQLCRPDAPAAKQARLEAVSRATTSGSLGFRIAGMKVWVGERGAQKRVYEEEQQREENGHQRDRGETGERQPAESDGPASGTSAAGEPAPACTPNASKITVIEVDGYNRYDRHYGHTLSDTTVAEGFRAFLAPAGPTRAPQLASRVAARIRSIQAALEQVETRMYSASILVVYEGDPDALGQALEEEENKRRREARQDDDNNAEEKQEEEEEEEEEDDVELPPGSLELVGISTTEGMTLNAAERNIENITNIPTSTSTNPSAHTGTDSVNIEIHPEDLGHLGGVDVQNILGSDCDSEEEPHKVVDVRLIDFAHGSWVPGQGPDENVLHGVRNAARILEGLAGEAW